MDKVRLGRALGYGARHAAKTVASVAEAATAPDPRKSIAAKRTDEVMPSQRARNQGRAAMQALPRAGRSFWGPLATFSSALWLRVTGLFFGLIAFAMANGAWRLRAGWHAEHRFWLFVGVATVFAYFAASSFYRAGVRERRAQR